MDQRRKRVWLGIIVNTGNPLMKTESISTFSRLLIESDDSKAILVAGCGAGFSIKSNISNSFNNILLKSILLGMVENTCWTIFSLINGSWSSKQKLLRVYPIKRFDGKMEELSVFSFVVFFLLETPDSTKVHAGTVKLFISPILI